MTFWGFASFMILPSFLCEEPFENPRNRFNLLSMNSSTHSRWSQGPCTVTTFGNFCPIRKARRARKDCVFERGQTTRWRSAADERRTPAERGVPDLWTYTDASPAHLSRRRRARSTEQDKRKAAIWTSPGPEIRVAHKKGFKWETAGIT